MILLINSILNNADTLFYYAQKLTEDIGIPNWLFFIFKILISTGILTTVLAYIYKLIIFAYDRYKNNKLSKDLHPFYSPLEIIKATKYYISTKCQNISPAIEQEPEYTHAFATKEKLIKFFIKKVFNNISKEDRYYILLADSGMGKTTFMINLYLKYTTKWFGRNYKIKLLPLGFPNVDDEIQKIDDKENTILLLDAFDEDIQAQHNYKERLSTICQNTYQFRDVVITCRTQFFPSEVEEPNETGVMKYYDKGLHRFRKLYISPFDNKDINCYLKKKFPFPHFLKRGKAANIVQKSKSLMVRPMLLSYIEDLLVSEIIFNYDYQIYEELIKKWIDREARREIESNREAYKRELNKFSKEVALDIYNNKESRSGLIINSEEISPLAERHGIKLNELDLKSRSLLNRNALGEYKFSHRSIMEYFIAKEACKNSAFENKLNFVGMDMAELFYRELCLVEYTIPFFANHLSNNFRGFYNMENNNKGIKISEINQNELKKVTSLSISDLNCSNLDFLKGFNYLYRLSLDNSNVRDVNSLRYTSELILLSLTNTNIPNLKFLQYQRKLYTLMLINNNIKNIEYISYLDDLVHLNLAYNDIVNLEPLSKLFILSDLNLAGTKVKNFEPLYNLNLTKLDLSDINMTPDALNEIKTNLPKCEINIGGAELDTFRVKSVKKKT